MIKELEMYRYVLVALAAFIFTAVYFVNNPNVETRIVEFHTETIKEVEVVPVNIIDYDELECMALNIYHEARGERIEGQVAVSQVVLNRKKSNFFPNTVCGVIKQAKISRWYLEHHNKAVPVRNQCQFSWYCDGKSDEIPKIDADLWNYVLAMSTKIASGYWADITHGATHYHADYVTPGWAKSKHKTAKIGDHIFYIWKIR